MSDKFQRQDVVTWEMRLQRAFTTQDVLAVAKDFIATWSPAEVGTLPEHLRPPRIRDGDDVSLYAFKLVSRPATGVNARMLSRMTTFFTAASERIAQICAVAASEAARAKADEDAG